MGVLETLWFTRSRKHTDASQLMTDASTTRWYLMMKCTLQRIVQLRGPESFSRPVALAIFNQYWVLESLRTLAFDEDNTLADPKWLSLLSRAEEPSTRKVATERDQTRLLRCMALLGRLNYRYGLARLGSLHPLS
jgi:hypothetical protein